MGYKVVKITIGALAGVAVGAGVAFFPEPAPAPSEVAEPVTPEAVPPEKVPLPVEDWSRTFRRMVREGSWEALDRELEVLLEKNRSAYDRADLAYLHGRAELEGGDLESARRRLAGFLEPGDPLRGPALYRLALLEERAGHEELASERRLALLLDDPEHDRFREVLEREIAFRQRKTDAPGELIELVDRVAPSTSGSLRRELDALLVIVFVRQEDVESARTLGLRLLRDSSADDAAEQTAVALDTPAVLATLGPEEKRTIGEALRSHRHFGRAVTLLEAAREALPRQREELDFSIGRALFFAERFDEALEAYLRGARDAERADAEVRFLYHASRAALLQGLDEEAAGIMDRAVARGAGGRSRAAVLDNRMRLRLRRGDVEGARADLSRLRREFGGDSIPSEAALAFASHRVLEGESGEALAILGEIRERDLDRYGLSEARYWQGRALEASAPGEALDRYLDLLVDSARSHFTYFARERLRHPTLAEAVAERRLLAENWVEEAMAAANVGEARRAAETLLVLGEEKKGRAYLGALYRRDEAYREFLNLRPLPWPSFPLEEDAGRGRRLLAMGLFDDAAPDIESLYGLGEAEEALTRSIALSRAGEPLGSIRAVEILVGRSPSDYRFEMYPRILKEQLYPRPFLERIGHEAAGLSADPRLMLAVMREESRFDARAKSAAAARGLMQFVITTARDVGDPLGLGPLEARDLYRPEVAVRLGAGYLGSLLDRFDRNRYAAVAAYNAGPNQASLWARLAPEASADAYLTHVSFPETKNYIRKVLNSYERYGEVWGDPAADPLPRITAW